MFILFSTMVLLLIAFGLINRHKRKIHVPVMATAFAIDLSLVLVIEIQRQAIENIVINQHNSFTWFHVIISTIVLVLYIVLAVTGYKMSKLVSGPMFYQTQLVQTHKITSIVFIVLRLTNYMTSLFMPVQIHL
jgi:uncharacterized membrane protein YozB (DUF420 family)